MSKVMTKRQRQTKNKVDRIRRFLVKNLETAKKNGWALKQGMWFGSGSACLFGVVLANDRGVNDPIEMGHLALDETAAAASICGLTENEVSSIITGFDCQGDYTKGSPGYKSNYNDCSGYYHPALFRLGWRLAEKYVGK